MAERRRRTAPTRRGGSRRQPSRPGVTDRDRIDIPGIPDLPEPTPPVLLLPVRLETKFSKSADELLIRVIPDIVHVDRHRVALTPTEADLGLSYWLRRVAAFETEDPVLGLYADLASQVGTARAAWVAHATRPVNWTPGEKPPATLDWPQPKVTKTPAPPPTAELMPLRWDARGYSDLQARSRASGSTIRSAIPMAPDFATDLPDDIGAVEFLREHGLGWMIDFDEAESLGLGIRLAVPPDYRDTGFDSLLVVGVPRRPSPEKRAQQLERHLTALRYTTGLRFVRRGSATNHTDAGAAATASRPTVADYARELDDPAPDRTTPTAERFRSALGLDAGSVVERIDGADDDQWTVADTMRTATWDAFEGKLLGGLLAEICTDDERDTIRDHAIAHHRPGGHLPVVQVGDQPYGIHLVSNRSSDWGAEPVGHVVAFETEGYATQADRYWDDGVSSVPRMNPLASNTDSPEDEPISTEQYLADVTAVLASEPNPAQLWLRSADSQRGELLARWAFLAFLLDAGTVSLPNERDEYLDRIQTNLREQSYALEQFSDDLDRADNVVGYTTEQVEAAHASRDLIDESMLPGVYQREDVIAPVDLLGRGYTRFSGKFDSGSNPELIDLEFDDVLAEWNAPIVADDDVDVTDVATMLDGLAGAAETGATMASPTTPASLLWTVLYASVRRVPAERRDEVAAALRDLARHVELAPATAIADLELVLLEYLGGASSRLDAWFSSAAAARLAHVTARGFGTAPPPFIGGWGAVLHLAPGPDNRTHGFIPAPTLTHAATAAVLRSGYETLGDEGITAPLAVDLQSDRVRRAMWLVDGIRAGAPPGDILGARLERRLQEAGRATLIDELRTVEADTLGVAAVPVIDGVAVARSQAEDTELLDGEMTDLETAFRDAIDAAATGPGNAEVRTIIAETTADLDAVADLTVAHSVHQLVQGQTPAARSSLESISTGQTTPPVPTVANSRPRTTGVAHTLLLDAPDAPSSWPGATTSLRSIGDPGAERLAAAVLPLPDTIRIEIVGDADAPVVVTALDALDVSALDAAIDIAPDGVVTGRVRAVALAAAGDIDGSSITRVAASSRAEAALAGRLGAVLRSGRAATELDTMPPEVPGATAAAADDDRRRRDLRGRLERVVKAGATVEHLDESATTKELLAALHRACDAPLPFLVTVPTPGWVSASSKELQPELGKAGSRVTGWLGQVAAVRPEVRQFTELIDVADAVFGVPRWSATAAQARPTDAWVATGAPERSPNHNVAIIGPDPLDDGLTPLVVDGWSDDVATNDASAAAAIHFDAPGAEPPNLWLLALRAEPGNWKVGDLFDCVQHTVLDAQRRMVGPQELPEIGQYLPATFLLADAGDDQEDVR